MSFALYMLDGLAEPPQPDWSILGAACSAAIGAPTHYHDRLDSVLIPRMRADLSAGLQLIAIGHSLGGERIEMLAASGIKLHAAVLIDAVRGTWERRLFDVQATHKIAFTRRWWLGFPPSMGLRDGQNVKLTAGHNGIVRIATPAIVEFVKQCLQA